MHEKYQIYNQDCYGLAPLKANSIDALITDPPYGISYQNNYWDKDLPDRKIWEDCLRIMKPGAFGLVFSSIRLMHRMMVALEDSGFIIKDVLFWAFLNGMPKSRDVALDIDKEVGVESEKTGIYNYVQGYVKGGAEDYRVKGPKHKLKAASAEAEKYRGAGLGIKPAYEPIILIQKKIEEKNAAKNLLMRGTGALNLEATRIPYETGEEKVGHNPHPLGRVAANIIRTEPFEDGYDKFFLIPKVRQYAEAFNHHPTLKPVALMSHLVKLVTFEKSTVLDPFMGSGSTGLATVALNRKFIGFELEKEYFEIAKKRLEDNFNNAGKLL